VSDITAKCTEVCGNSLAGKSCSKICLVNVYVSGRPETKVKSYVVIDDQSNGSLAKSELFDRLNVHDQTMTYSLKTCAGVTQIRGRCSKRLILESLDGTKNTIYQALLSATPFRTRKKRYPHHR
jgi:hypothetical protein